MPNLNNINKNFDKNTKSEMNCIIVNKIYYAIIITNSSRK